MPEATKKRLKPRQDYVDRYDRLTVEDCRERERFHKSYKPSEPLPQDIPKNFLEKFSDVTLHYDLLFTTLRWWEKKEETIQRWMDQDTGRDRVLDTTNAPENIRCLRCHTSLFPTFKELLNFDEDKRNRVLFMYGCPNGCLPRRAFFDDGEEYRPKRNLCPKCNIDLDCDDKKSGEKITSRYSCKNCGYENVEELDFSVKKEIPDSEYEKDRARFCLTKEVANKYMNERFQLEQVDNLVEEIKEKESRKEEYDDLKKIQRITALDLEKILTVALEKNGYVRLQFGTPDIGKDLFVPFTVQDSKSERNDRESAFEIRRIIKRTLEGTNWRLMSDGVSYRMGFLTGRLRAYEREEDLLELVKRKMKKPKGI